MAFSCGGHWRELCSGLRLQSIVGTGEWDPYWHMMEELQERADKGTKAAATKTTAKKPATAAKRGRR